ncbi:ABC transporter substrate-binding protein [Caldisericum sp.]|uniref:ABC transporter substrate-binding protein n=2 Tax=Caldisericum TaxID=693074 RepID=UPI003C91810F
MKKGEFVMLEKVKKFLQIFLISLLFAVIIFYLTSCIGYVKVLVVAPLSSDTKEAGESTVNGIRLKVDELNKSGGIIGKRIKVYVVDDKGDPDSATQSIRDVLSKNNFIGIVGAPFSRIAIPVSEVCEDLKIPFVTSVATNPLVTKGKEFSFRACFTDDLQGVALAHFVYEYLGLRVGGVFYDIDDTYSVYLAEKFRSEFENLGGHIVAFYPHPHKPVTVEFPIQKMLEKKVQFVFNPDLYVDASMVYTELRKQNFTGPVIFGDGVDAPQLLARIRKPFNVYYVSHYLRDSEKLIKFSETYKETFKMDPDVEAYLAYDAMGILATAIEKANSFDKVKIKDALENLTYDGITGKIEFKNSNDPTKPLYFYGFKNFIPSEVWVFGDK